METYEYLNSKLFGKYDQLKRRKFPEDEEWTNKRVTVVKAHQNENDELIEDLKSKNEKLLEQVAKLEEMYEQERKLFLSEKRKTTELSKEVERLQTILSEKNDSLNIASPGPSYTSPRTRSRSKSQASRKKKTPSICNKENEVQHKEAALVPYQHNQEHSNMPDCCRSYRSSVDDASSGGKQQICAFQTLLELLFNMKLSVKCKPDRHSVFAIHERTGYTFTLSWRRREDEREVELMYHMSSLGTLERIANERTALGWMTETLIFSPEMLPVFFKRMSEAVGRP